MKKTMLFVITAICAVLLLACAGNYEEIAGVWGYSDETMNNLYSLEGMLDGDIDADEYSKFLGDLESLTYEFREDGTLISHHADGTQEESTYSMRGNIVSFDANGDMTELILEGDYLLYADAPLLYRKS